VAEELYQDAMYDAFQVPEAVTDLRLVSLSQWNVNAHLNPVVRSTSLLGSVQLTNFKYNGKKKHLEIGFEVYPTAVEPLLAQEVEMSEFLPLKELIPDFEQNGSKAEYWSSW